MIFLLGVLGMRLLKKMDFPEMTFSLYFLGYVNESDIPSDEKERTRWCFSQKATLEVGVLFARKCDKQLFIADPQLGD